MKKTTEKITTNKTTIRECDFNVGLAYSSSTGTDLPINSDLDNELYDFFREEFDMERIGSGSGFGVRDMEFFNPKKYKITDDTPPPIDMDYVLKCIESMIEKYNDVEFHSLHHWWNDEQLSFCDLYTEELIKSIIDGIEVAPHLTN